MKNKKQRGFSLIELMVVMAIILIITALAIPSYLKAKNAANGTSAAASLRTLNTGLQMFANSCFGSYPAGSAGTGLADLGSAGSSGTPTACVNTNGILTIGSGQGQIVDTNLLTGSKNGYTFTYNAGTPDGTTHAISDYFITAIPQTGTSDPTVPQYCIDSGSQAVHVVYGATPGTGATLPYHCSDPSL